MLERGFIGGALLVGLLNWAPFDSSWSLFASFKAVYIELFNTAATLFFQWH